MRALEELEALERKALVISQIPDRRLRHKGGFMLEHECRSLDGRHRILGGLDRQSEVSLRAVLQIIFDYILYDALEDEDWMSILPERFEGDLERMVAEYKAGENAS